MVEEATYTGGLLAGEVVVCVKGLDSYPTVIYIDLREPDRWAALGKKGGQQSNEKKQCTPTMAARDTADPMAGMQRRVEFRKAEDVPSSSARDSPHAPCPGCQATFLALFVA